MELNALILSLARHTLEQHRSTLNTAVLRPTFSTIAALALPLLREGDPEVGGLYAALALRFGGPGGLCPDFSRREAARFLAYRGHLINLPLLLEQTFPDLHESDRRSLLAEAYRTAAEGCTPAPSADPGLRWEGDFLIRDGSRLVSCRQDAYALVLPDFIHSIEPLAFYNCPGLTVLVLPPNLEEFSPQCTEVCTQLTHIFMPRSEESRFFSHDGILYSEEDFSLVRCPPGRQGTVFVPEWVESIGPSAFAGCHLLEDVLLPEGLESIGDRAFLGCLSLGSVSIPDSVLTVGHLAFSCCPCLTLAVFNGPDTEFEDDTFDEDSDLSVWAMPASAAEMIANDLGILSQWDPDLCP